VSKFYLPVSGKERKEAGSVVHMVWSEPKQVFVDADASSDLFHHHHAALR